MHRMRMLLLAVLVLVVGGAALAADTDIVITEIMQNPFVLADAVGEWFEVHNTGPDPVDLNGWTIKDNGTDNHVIAASAVVPAGGYAVLCIDAASMAGQGVTALYQYTGVTLANGDDEVILLNASAVEIDRVEYDGGPIWPDPNGASMSWDEGTADNNVGTNWGEGAVAFGGGDLGTPGAANGAPALQAPSIYDVYPRPLAPEPAEAVTVSATVTDDGTVTSVTLYYRVNGGGFSSIAMALDTGDTYTAVVPGQADGAAVDYYVEATDNDAQTSTNPFDAPVTFYTYTVAPEVITPIATVHADSLGNSFTLVTVQGQVYIPGNYQADGTGVSAYIQDASGRGLNIFGTTRSTGMDLLNSTGNIVKVTGYADYYFTTLELLNYEVELVSSGNPALSPAVQTSGNAAAPTNEGTYVETSGTISAVATTGGTNPAHNFTVSDGSGDVVIRIDDDLVDMTAWTVGDHLTAAGAGATFNAQGQILVGLLSDLTYTPGVDVTPPTLVSAEKTGSNNITVNFSESVETTSAQNPGNYEVYETGNEANMIPVVSVLAFFPDNVQLVTGFSLTPGTPYTVRVNNVEDLAGNVIAANSTVSVFEPGATPAIVINEVMQNPLSLADTDGEWFEIYNADVVAVDINGWTIRDAGTNVHVIDNGGPLVIQPGEYQVLGINALAMAGEGVTLFYEYANFALGNADDEIELLDTLMQQVDIVAYDGGPVWPDPTGGSMQWSGTGDNNDGSTWGVGGPAFGSGDHATPGLPNNTDTGVDDAPALVTALGRNFPNPFNPKTSFSFTLKQDERVTLEVFDLRGRTVRTVVDARLQAGAYENVYSWDGTDAHGRPVTSGTYFFRLKTGSGESMSRTMTLLK
ncbi:MAG TPA: lamin tail domain-containing protein [Candidatus Krumholzibacteria bacterium]|nr:lamin tail domain-containing protein [Candidatus Krumholzibacteria bacterium]HRX52316.1 lamin tail domain-containing protein [Candidatus Krumholzibacteria bacterium]